MDVHHGEKHIREECSVCERQTAYSLNRLAAAVSELSRLIDIRPSSMVERLIDDLDNAAGYASAGIEVMHKLRQWRTNYHWLATELNAGTHSFQLAEEALVRRIDAVIADWERWFDAAGFGAIGLPAPALGGRRRTRGLFRRGSVNSPLAPARPAASRDSPGPDTPPAPDDPPPALGAGDADIAARVLGPMEVSVAGVRVLRWSSLKARAVFQYLLIHQGRPIRREVLMELEWPNHSHNSARNNLNVALCSLRNTLDWSRLDVQAILHKDGCYLLNPDLTCWTDRNEFLSRIHDARGARQAGHTDLAINACRSAVQLYRGPLFEDDLDGVWYLPERRHLKELYLQALEHLAEIYYESGQLQAAVEFGQQVISADPCYEAAHRLLMRCYALQHQQQLVSRQFRLCAAALHDELDVAPTTETVQLFRALTATA